MKRLARFLVPVYCWLLVMPLGWCCWLVPTMLQAAAKAPESCCCCPREQNPPTPAPPAQAPWCCEQVPAAFLTLPDDADLALPTLPVPFAELLANVSPASPTPAVVVIDSSPPLRVLHCTWLC